jgi:hypothetical protein
MALQRLRDLEIVDDSMDATLEDCFTKIDQEPEAESGQPEIRQKLLEMSRH